MSREGPTSHPHGNRTGIRGSCINQRGPRPPAGVTSQRTSSDCNKAWKCFCFFFALAAGIRRCQDWWNLSRSEEEEPSESLNTPGGAGGSALHAGSRTANTNRLREAISLDQQGLVLLPPGPAASRVFTNSFTERTSLSL